VTSRANGTRLSPAPIDIRLLISSVQSACPIDLVEIGNRINPSALLFDYRPSCGRWFWPIFHYADFHVTSATSPRRTRDVPFSPNSITPTSPKLPRPGKFQGSQRNGIWAKGDVTGLSRTSRDSGIWSLPTELRPLVLEADRRIAMMTMMSCNCPECAKFVINSHPTVR